MTTCILEQDAETMNHKRVNEVGTDRETVNESKVKSQIASKSIDANDHDIKEGNIQVLEEVEIEDLVIENQDKVGDENKDVCASALISMKNGISCRLAIGTKENVVGVGIIFDYDMEDDNMKKLEFVGSKIQMNVPIEVFGIQQKCCIFLEILR
ncbi:uncharacterized protein E5676_scaffold306G001970 [Cucumis melo var. makuwa]|uniref:Uncharacterized protein n=1 Tax=Cucumis melo var. makuwa TaxID=1194695 RepID=A0A5D3D2W8_CUCMM|nr:uncharacterized protein E6C27_scaffold67G004070 [Cucumis melo var. makuwa]TYK17908.1 uncharacterized protein E5676_scaffold306G001970 [Cucumis melo var. makuwa]